MGYGLPCERTFELDGKGFTVTFLEDDRPEYLALCDGFIFFYDFQNADSLIELRRAYLARVLKAKGWSSLRNSVLVSSWCRSNVPAVPVADAVAFATEFGMPHFSVMVSQRLRAQLTEEEQNVKEAVYAVVRQLRPKEVILAATTRERKKCVIM